MTMGISDLIALFIFLFIIKIEIKLVLKIVGALICLEVLFMVFSGGALDEFWQALDVGLTLTSQIA